MTKLVLLIMPMLLLLASTIAWSYPDGSDSEIQSAESEIQNEATALRNYYDVNADTAMYDIGDDEDDNIDDVATLNGPRADTNRWRHRRRNHRRKHHKRKPRRKPQSDNGICGCVLTAYTYTHFKGRALPMQMQNADFQNDKFPYYPQSLKITGDCQWLLYENVNFEGKAVLLMPGSYTQTHSWGGRPKVASVRALPPKGTEAIALFEKGFYAGQMVVLYDSTPDLPHLTGFDSEINSFIVTKGKWTLFENDNYEGTGYTYTGEAGEYSQSTPIARTRKMRSIKKG